MVLRLSVAVLCVAVGLPAQVLGQEVSNLYGVDTENAANSAALSGGNTFDFSNSRSNPPAPGLPSFAGGPCVGAGTAASTSIAGVALGAGKSTLDDSCQRRNWVQALIGASQHMSDDEARVLLQVAVEVMRDDPYLAGPMERVGLGSTSAAGMDQALKNEEKLEELRQTVSLQNDAAGTPAPSGTDDVQISSKNIAFAKDCVVSLNRVPKGVQAFLEAKKCRIEARGESN